MTPNVGTIDRTMRFLLGLILVIAPLLNIPAIWSGPVLSYGAMAIGLVLMATSALAFCPLYRILGLSTCNTCRGETRDER